MMVDPDKIEQAMQMLADKPPQNVDHLIHTRCFICHREIRGLERTPEAIKKREKGPWIVMGQEGYPLCEDFGLEHLPL